MNNISFAFAYAILLFYSSDQIGQILTGYERPRWLLILFVPLILYTISNQFLNPLFFGGRPHLYNLLLYNRLAGYLYLREHVPRQDAVIYPLVHEPIYSGSDKKVAWIYRYHNYGFPILAEKRSFFIRPNHVPNFSPDRLGGTQEQGMADWELFFKTDSAAVAKEILDRSRFTGSLTHKESGLSLILQDG